MQDGITQTKVRRSLAQTFLLAKRQNFVLLPAADYDGCKNLSLHSTSYGPISGRRRR